MEKDGAFKNKINPNFTHLVKGHFLGKPVDTWSSSNLGLNALQVGIGKWLLEIVSNNEKFPPNLQKGMNDDGLSLPSP